MSGEEHDETIDGAELSDEMPDRVSSAGADEFFGTYSVLSPGVEIVLDGRPVSTRSGG